MPNWGQVLNEINNVRASHTYQAQIAADSVRRKYLSQLSQYTGRNVIAYYSGFLSKPNIPQSEITDEDKNGFMMAVSGLNKPLKDVGLDLILHTEGGNIAATQSIVDYLRKMFGKNIRAIVPQIAMSAGTMLACSCKKILMATHSNLGPIDPHLAGVPATGVKEEFERAHREIKKDPSWAEVWAPVLRQYGPTFLSQCENAIRWSNAFVREQLASVMFEGQADAKKKGASIVRKLTSYRGNATHTRHIHREECQDIGLDVDAIETPPEQQDLILTVHHCYMNALMNTNAFKIIENQNGAALVRHITR